MKIAKITAVMSTVVLAAVATPRAGFGKTIPIKTQGDVKSGCGGAGDVYFPKNSNGVFGCMKSDGSGVVCGGSGKYAKTCDTFMQVPPHLPTRPDVEKFQKLHPEP